MGPNRRAHSRPLHDQAFQTFVECASLRRYPGGVVRHGNADGVALNENVGFRFRTVAPRNLIARIRMRQRMDVLPETWTFLPIGLLRAKHEMGDHRAGDRPGEEDSHCYIERAGAALAYDVAYGSRGAR